jgi:hypothetical protein
MLYAESKSYLTLWNIDKSDKYATVKCSSSRKDKMTDAYKNSNWSYVKFVGEAFQAVKSMKEKDRITNINFSISCEPYEKNGETIYPKSPQIVVYSFEKAESGKTATGGKSATTPKKPTSKPIASAEVELEDIDDDSLPF